MKQNSYYSNGKFLLTGEYVILDGAESLVLPLKYGQKLTIKESEKSGISFSTFEYGKLIYQQDFIFSEQNENPFSIPNSDLNDFNSQYKRKEDSNKYILKILNAIHLISPNFFKNKSNLEIIAELNFDINWGLGSSSSLIANFAQWSGLDKYEFFKQVSNGSGYDVFAALENKPFIYHLFDKIPTIKSIEFENKVFEDVLFIYLGKKQDSSQEVKKYKKNSLISNSIIEEITEITRKIIHVRTIAELNILLNTHERIISKILSRKTIQNEYFNDFNGTIKSLGAWGGDFVMASSELGKNYIIDYCNKKQFAVFIEWSDIVL